MVQSRNDTACSWPSANGNRKQLAATIDGTADFANDYLFDNLGRMTRVTQSGGTGVAAKRVDFTYTSTSQFDTITRYNNLAGAQPVASGQYAGYDARDRLVETDQPNALTGQTLSANGAPLGPVTKYSYNLAGSLETTTDPLNNVTTCGYDNLGRLTSVTAPCPTTGQFTGGLTTSYAYDLAGNREEKGSERFTLEEYYHRGPPRSWY